MYKIISALGGDFIKNKLEELKYEVVGDIDNQESLFNYLNKKTHLVVSIKDLIKYIKK